MVIDFVGNVGSKCIAELMCPRISGLFVDVDRSKALWDTVYRAPDALIKEGDWIDRASFGIPYTYAFTGAVLADAMTRNGNAKAAAAIMTKVQAIVKAARIEGFLRS